MNDFPSFLAGSLAWLRSATEAVNGVLWTYVLLVLLVGAGVWFTVRTGFVQLRLLPEMFRVLFGGGGKEARGQEISPFQAFCVGLASRVGVGNIAGVAVAIALGGPGAVFWMWVIAFIGSATAFVESTLGQIYKLPKAGGGYQGGAAYYIRDALGRPRLAALFAVLSAATFPLVFNSLQSNTIAIAMESSFGAPLWLSAALLVVLTGAVVFGGLHRIAKVAETIVPAMAGIYILAALAVIALHVRQVPHMLGMVLAGAFKPSAAVAGGFGAAVMAGVRNGLFSNEAGIGSVPNAAATAVCTHPVRQGLVEALGVYVDTWFVCTASAFTILLSGAWHGLGEDADGVLLVQEALVTQFGAWAGWGLTVLVLFFAFSSIIGYYFYGEINIAFFPGRGKHRYALLRLGTLAMVALGCVVDMMLVWNVVCVFMGVMCLMNLYAIVRLGPRAFLALADYVRQRRAGAKAPVFDPASVLPTTRGIQSWPPGP